MVDYFALLNEPRRPWVDPESIKERFLKLSATLHPDRSHEAGELARKEANDRFAELNAAHNCLREPKERLAHLLELETGARPADTRNVPEAAMDLSFEVGRICREADGFLAAMSKITSSVAKAQMFANGMELTEKLGALGQRINARRDELAAELQGMNAAWESAPALGTAERRAVLPLERLEQACRMLSYIARWTGQIQERVAALAF